MNPTDWQYTHQRQWKSIDPRQRTDSREKTENVPHCAYSVNDKIPHTMMGTYEELEHHNLSSHRHRSYRLNSNNCNTEMVTSDPDNEPEELSKIVEELARKRRELQHIEKKILLKKTTDDVKTTGPSLKAKTPCRMFKEELEEDLSHSKVDCSVKNTKPFMNTLEKGVGFSSSKWSSAYNYRPLKERVNVLLQQRCPDGFLSQAISTPSDHLPSPNPVEKTNTSTLNKADHPLKLRVKALLNRHRNSGVLDSHGEVPVVKPPPSCESPSTTVAENNLVVNGFQRFLSVLNKGVDIEMLTKIVNDDEEFPPTGQELLHSLVKEKSDVCKIESQRLQRGAGQRDRLSCSKERKTELLNQDISHRGGKRNIQPEEKSTHSDDRGSSHFGSSCRSRSTPVVEEKKPKLEQHEEELQNILKTIGFSLDADDMCKLAERTQERLYGIKNETKQKLDSTRVSEKRQQNLRNPHSPSSSFTSVSDSSNSSPSRHQHSCSKTFRDSREQTQCSEYQHSRQRSRESGREQERERDGDKDNNTIVSRDSAPGRHLYPETPEYLVPYPDAASAIPTYHSDTASAIPTYHSDTASAIPTYTSDTASAIPMYNSNPAFAIPAYNSDAASAIPTYNSDVASAIPTYISGDAASAIPTYISVQHSKQELNTIRKVIALVNRDPANNSGKEHTFLQELAGKEQNILKRLEQNSDRSLSEGQTGQRSDLGYPHAINTVQHSGYTAYHSDTSNGASSTAWNYGSNVIPPSSSSYPPGFCNYSTTPLCPSADTGALFGQDYPHPYLHPYPPAACNTALGHSYFNTDLSLIEGQTGQRSLPHYLNINPHCQTKLTDMQIPKNKTAVQINGQELSNSRLDNLKRELNTTRKVIALMNRDPRNHKFLQELAGREQNILIRLEQNSDLSLSEGQTGQKSGLCHLHSINTVSESTPIKIRPTIKRKTKKSDKRRLKDGLIYKIKTELKFVGISIARARSDPANNSEEQRKILEKLAGEEQDILKRLEQVKQNSDPSLNEGQTGQQSAVDTVTKAKFQREENKMAGQKEGQKESQRSIQGQQLEVELPTEEEMNANLTKKVAAGGVVSSEAATSVQ